MSEVKNGKKKQKDEKLPLLLTRALLSTKTFDEERNSVDVVFATDEPILVRSYYEDETYYEVLSFDPEHVRMTRMLSGAPALDNHNKYGKVSEVVLGVIENPVLEKKQGSATIRFSKRKDNESLVADVKDGIITNISTGYKVYMYRDITKTGDKYRTLLAIDWEPTEVSMVPVPADYRSGVRALSLLENPAIEQDDSSLLNVNNELNLNKNRSDNMEKTPEEVAAEKAAKDNLDKTRNESTLAERTRAKEINELVRSAGLDQAFADTHIEGGNVLDGAEGVRALVIKEVAKKQENPINGISGAASVTGVDTERAEKIMAAEEIVSIRAYGVSSLGKDGPKTELGKSSANGRRVHMLELARNYVALSGGHNVQLMSDDEVLTRAMSSTDFPIALANVFDKQLRKRYAMLEPKWKKFAVRDDAPDFKPRNTVIVDGDFVPDQLAEGGEYSEAVLKEGGDKWAISTYGKKVSLTRKMMVNDDLSAFTRLTPFYANGMVERQTKVVMALLAGAGRVLGDGIALFDAAHGNVAAAGSVMSEASFTAARVAMQTQKTLSGSLMASEPVYLWIPPQLVTQAKKLINASIIATKTADTNVFQGEFEIVNDPYLQDNPTTWYLVADPSMTEVIKYGELQGQGGIYTEQRYNFNNDNLEIKFRNDFGATIEEHRGLYKNAGA